jgi:enhancer of mRNA-decapping protein 4
MQDALNQLVSMQKELHKQMTVMVAVPVNKEGKRMEGMPSANCKILYRSICIHLQAVSLF